jgi:hypothetical protein
VELLLSRWQSSASAAVPPTKRVIPIPKDAIRFSSGKIMNCRTCLRVEQAVDSLAWDLVLESREILAVLVGSILALSWAVK